MACGVGACLGCSLPTVSGNKRVCADGPVFDAAEVIWHA
jgi:dihydroorotate dehydrogenase electron transfer subunit